MSKTQATKVRRLTKENVMASQDGNEPPKRMSIYPKDDDGPTPQTTTASMRRMSRWDPSKFGPMSRRYSQASRTSISGASQSAKQGFQQRVENTYKMNPDDKFESHTVRDIMKRVLNQHLNGCKYTPQIRSLTTTLTDEIKDRVKALGYRRYKFVVTVTIGEDTHQGMQVVSRCLWNKETDNFAEAEYFKDDLYAVATLYACYYE